MNDLINDLITDEIRNHSLNASALIDYLSLKGIIDVEDFFKYRDEYAKTYIKSAYPDLPVE